MKVVGYSRVSGQTQVEGDGFPRQEENIKKFCNAQRLDPKLLFREEGVSGTVEGLDRPAFARALEFIETQRGCGERVEGIVVERMDRLARDLLVQELLIRECRARKIKIFAADRGELVDVVDDAGDPTRKLIRQVLGAVAEWEKSVLVKKLYVARMRCKRWGGDPAYGAKAGEKRVIQFMQSARVQGRSFEQIAKEMNDLGMPSRHGKKWGKKTVARILNRLNAPTLQPVEKSDDVVVCTT